MKFVAINFYFWIFENKNLQNLFAHVCRHAYMKFGLRRYSCSRCKFRALASSTIYRHSHKYHDGKNCTQDHFEVIFPIFYQFSCVLKLKKIILQKRKYLDFYRGGIFIFWNSQSWWKNEEIFARYVNILSMIFRLCRLSVKAKSCRGGDTQITDFSWKFTIQGEYATWFWRKYIWFKREDTREIWLKRFP